MWKNIWIEEERMWLQAFMVTGDVGRRPEPKGAGDNIRLLGLRIWNEAGNREGVGRGLRC